MHDLPTIQANAALLGYPVVIKSWRGGRGRGERLVHKPEQLETAVQRASAESRAVFGNGHIYLERAMLPAHQIGVQLLGDRHGHLIHLGEREGSIIVGNQKIIEEAPSPLLNDSQRQTILAAALAIGRMFNYQNVGTVEFCWTARATTTSAKSRRASRSNIPLPKWLPGLTWCGSKF